jgi:hypothetical protein
MIGCPGEALKLWPELKFFRQQIQKEIRLGLHPLFKNALCDCVVSTFQPRLGFGDAAH